MADRSRGRGIGFEIIGIVLIGGGIIACLALLGQGGAFGVWCRKLLLFAFGVGAWLVPVVLALWGAIYVWRHDHIRITARVFYWPVLFWSGLSLWHDMTVAAGHEILPDNLPSGGGIIGGLTVFYLRRYFDALTAAIILTTVFAVFFILLTGRSVRGGLEAIVRLTGRVLGRKRPDGGQDGSNAGLEEMEALTVSGPVAGKPRLFDQAAGQKRKLAAGTERSGCLAVDLLAITDGDRQETAAGADGTATAPAGGGHFAGLAIQPASGGYQLPPLALLEKPAKTRSSRLHREQQDNARLLEETLASFGVGARIVNIVAGPAVTRYEIEPAAGVKVSRVVSLADDIALKLATFGVRIEAPIPGKAAIGIEVPNRDVATVSLREVLESGSFQSTLSPLAVGLGKDIAGQAVVADLAKMPHLLVAGATGSGKSVCINTIVCSILCRATPDQVRFILIDPKMVELSVYKPIPHLLTPVVTDAEQAAAGLRWAVQEMERRYNVCARHGVRDIVRYNAQQPDAVLPYIIIVIDELADLMMVAPVDVEDAICRLAQKARAAGIHLLLATQRPSVDVITGTIKANIPSRISFAVSSQTDSRTILDMAGAEKLLGKGDMLYFPVGVAKPLRVQGAYLHDAEVDRLVAFISSQGRTAEYETGVTELSQLRGGDGDGGERSGQDELLEQAVRVVLETGQASASLLQRKFRVGYARAARLIDAMEEMKIVGPNTGSRGRDILMTSEQVFSRYFAKDTADDE
ncbi:MAG: DNA translocase FtsK [Negativicutes bacterium]|nr:DNA translocase FtsK [Negativicutes bacterium]